MVSQTVCGVRQHLIWRGVSALFRSRPGAGRTAAAAGAVLLLAALGAQTAWAVPAAPVKTLLTQKDGSSFPARLYGDEWRNGYETLEGYSVVQDTKSGDWFYAQPDTSGKLVPTSLRPEKDAPPAAARNLRSKAPSAAEEMALVDGKTLKPSSAGRKRFTGSHKVLFILVRFSDQNSVGSTAEDWHQKAFGPTNSLRHYYREVSYGNLDLTPAPESHGAVNDGVVGWLNLGIPHPNTRGNSSNQNRTLTRNAILAADPYVDFASYDTDGNGHISLQELQLVVIAAGYEASYGGLGASVWGHMWELGGVVPPPTVDGVDVAGGEFGGGYMQFGEWHANPFDTPGHLATIGIMCHEIGHGLDMPDLYDVFEGDGESEGVGSWCLMSGGSWNALPGQYPGSRPPHPCAFLKTYQGWVTPQLITQAQRDVPIPQAATNASVIQVGSNPNGVDWDFGNQSGAGEYFLVENRQQVGYDAALPGSGLLVWHIDETRSFTNIANSDETRRLVDLEEADGLANLDNADNRGDDGDPFPGRKDNRKFNRDTNPNSRLYSGVDSLVDISAISDSGEVMTATFGRAILTVENNDMFADRAPMSGQAGTVYGVNVDAGWELEEPDHAGMPAERSLWWKWTAPADGRVDMHTQGSTFDTRLAVYTGTELAALTPVEANDNVNGPVDRTSRVSFFTTLGTTYIIAVDGARNTSGSVQLNWRLYSERYRLTAGVTPWGGGSIGLNPPPGPDGKYPAGATVQVTAHTGAGHWFSGWSGGLSGRKNPETVTLSSNVTIGALFGRIAGSRYNPVQGVRVVAEGAGWQEMVFNFGTGAISVTPYQDQDGVGRYTLPASEPVGIYHYDFATGRFASAIYRTKEPN